MDDPTAPKTAAGLGLRIAIPEGIDPVKVAARKELLFKSQAYDRRTLNGTVAAETAALQVEMVQAERDSKFAGRAVQTRTPVQHRLATPAASDDQGTLDSDTKGLVEGMLARGASGDGIAPPHLLTMEEVIVLTPSQSSK